MLQIRLSRGPSGDGGGGGGGGAGTKPAAAPAPAAEIVTVACPDHLVLSELPVAKSLGAVTSSAHPAVRSLGRRSRRATGDRVHFCVQCDFPIAIYGRLIPCEHVFCLACARSDPSCYLCDERIQKIQTIKLMEGIFICAAPHCLKSFLKKSEFEVHIHETHADLLQPETDREGGNEADVNMTRASSIDLHKQPSLPESSTARAPPRPVFSPSSNSQLQDREERSRRQPSRDQPPPKPSLQAKPPFHNRPYTQPGDPQTENNSPQGFDRTQNWVNFQSFENQSGPQHNRDSSPFPPDKQIGIPPEFSFSTYLPLHPLQAPNYPVAMNVMNQSPVPTPFSFPVFPTDGPQPYYSALQETPQREKVPENGSEQVSVLGFPPAPAVIGNFPDNFARPWGMGFMGVPFDPSQVAQGIPEGFGNPTDSQGGVPNFQGGYPHIPQGLHLNPPFLAKDLDMKGSIADQNDGKGVLAPLPLPLPLQLPLPLPPPPPLPPPMSQQLNNNSKFPGSSDANREGQGYGWQSESRGFVNGPD